MSLDPTDKIEVFARLDATDGPTLGLAVSGGGDSMALTALAFEWAKDRKRRIAAVTVDHGLRSESADEAQRVAAFAGELGISHDTLHWQGWDGQGNLQDKSRRARASLITDWALGNGIKCVSTGHTRDDQAETLLLRLARGSGVDGLSAMADTRTSHAITWHRPLLNVARTVLRDYLANEGLPWIDDPSNDDLRFDRVKARRALDTLSTLGITADGLVLTAERMGRARAALESATGDLAAKAAKADHGDLLLDWTSISSAPEEIRNRLVAAALMWVSGAEYRPRASALESAIEAMETQRTTVLSGCQIGAEGSGRRITRELAAVRDASVSVGQVWDNRWRIIGPATAQGDIRALGDQGIRACPDWRESGLPRTTLIASPSVWKDNRLIAAPLAGFGRGWKAELIEARAHFVGR